MESGRSPLAPMSPKQVVARTKDHALSKKSAGTATTTPKKAATPRKAGRRVSKGQENRRGASPDITAFFKPIGSKDCEGEDKPESSPGVDEGAVSGAQDKSKSEPMETSLAGDKENVDFEQVSELEKITSGSSGVKSREYYKRWAEQLNEMLEDSLSEVENQRERISALEAEIAKLQAKTAEQHKVMETVLLENHVLRATNADLQSGNPDKEVDKTYEVLGKEIRRLRDLVEEKDAVIAELGIEYEGSPVDGQMSPGAATRDVGESTGSPPKSTGDGVKESLGTPLTNDSTAEPEESPSQEAPLA